MIDPNYLGVIELLITGVVVLGFGAWQLWSVRDALPWRRRKDSPSDPGHPEG